MPVSIGESGLPYGTHLTCSYRGPRETALTNGILVGSAVFTTRRYVSVVYAVFMCLSVRHKPVLYRNDWTNQAVLCGNADISKNKYTSLWNFVPNSELSKFRHSMSMALSTKLVDF